MFRNNMLSIYKYFNYLAVTDKFFRWKHTVKSILRKVIQNTVYKIGRNETYRNLIKCYRRNRTMLFVKSSILYIKDWRLNKVKRVTGILSTVNILKVKYTKNIYKKYLLLWKE